MKRKVERRRRRAAVRRGPRSLAGLARRRPGRRAAPSTTRCKELTLPLHHEDVIRQQADEKGVDAALIAAVIYSESKFSDQTSSAGARGLMQITPEAAEDHRAGTAAAPPSNSTTSPTPKSTSATGPSSCANCSNATTATRRRRSPPTTPAPATPTSGAAADLTVEDIPFPETRAYVEEVLEKQRRVPPASTPRSWAIERRAADPASPPWPWRSASSSPTPRSSSWRCRTSTANSTPASPASPGCSSPSTW